ncbi:hypothetical protein K1W54_29770 [Micromonospora sp. CPCC 205371]|nr:hypothetical protein [Micromonospora sp. CPCC 205371]
MSLADDVDLAAVTAAEHALARHFPEATADRLQEAAETVVAAVRPFVDGSELARVQEADSRGNVTA